MSANDELIPAYIARERCGCVSACVVDEPDCNEARKKFFQEVIQYDLIVERVTVGYVREHWGEKCANHQARQMPLEFDV